MKLRYRKQSQNDRLELHLTLKLTNKMVLKKKTSQ